MFFLPLGKRLVSLLGVLLTLVCASAGRADPPPVIAFTAQILHWDGSLTEPTSLQFGPDGRLYVAQLDGFIHVFTIERLGVGDYQVVNSETISLVHDIPNHNDDGTPYDGRGRYVTGLLVAGSAERPVIYVPSSDYRSALEHATLTWLETDTDTNSGILSRLTWDGTQWVKLDLVRGLPRSTADHVPNGLALDAERGILYLAIGGMTNMGAPREGVASAPEYALSAAVLAIDLNAIGDTTYDLPTLDDPNRPGSPDLNDPFGGQRGMNQAVIRPDSPVQIYASGFRNLYDLALTEDGRLYGFDNGANDGAGGPPVNEGLNGRCANAVANNYAGERLADLHLITPGYYGGHPNPTRGNAANMFGGQSPIVEAAL